MPKLNYEYDALEPYIDAETMQLHHEKHHQAYLDKLNTALESHPELTDMKIAQLLLDLESVPEDIRTAVRNNGGGFYNHNLFFNMLALNKTIPAKLQDKLTESFGSVDKFKEEFSTKATTVFGSGWAWLIENEQGKLEIVTTPNQDNPISTRKVKLLLALDVWEHAYYLKYQNRRPEYVSAWWNVVDWDYVEQQLG